MRHRILTVLAALLAAPALHAQTLDTRGTFLWNFQTNTGLVGQSFVAPDAPGVALTDFTMWVGSAYDVATYRASLYAFDDGDPARVVGSALYESELRTTTGWDTRSNPQAFVTGAIALTPGATYLALLRRTTPGDFLSGVTLDEADGYVPGRLYVATQFGSDPTPLQFRTFGVDPWRDLTLVAHFATVPEPGSARLLAVGLVAAALVGRRGRRARLG